MRLGDFLKYESIVIQCHNNPDPDALASGFAVWKYLTRNGKKPVFVYGGREAVSKPNLLLMIRLFGIPVHHVKDQAEIIDLLQREREETDVLPAAGQKPDLLIMTDCQYGESNTQKFEAGMVAVIDHHEVVDPAALPEKHLVMENYGSCATVVYGMLREEGYDFSSDGELQTALFYGLYTDTVRLQELWHPADKDMWDELDADDSSIKKLKNANIDEKDLVSIGNALLRRRISPEHHYGFIETETGDPNILGIVSDTFLEVDSVNVCVAYAYLPGGVKISVRSCLKEIRADELAKVIAEDVGNAGGHVDKAGGFLQGSRLFPEKMEDLWERKHFFEGFLDRRLRDYFEETDTIPAGQTMDVNETALNGDPGYRLYRKKPVRSGVVRLPEYFPAGTRLKVRTLEGETEFTVSGNTLLMVGSHDEPYPIEADKFFQKYRLTGEKFAFTGEYDPVVRNQKDGKRIRLDGITEECVTTGSSYIYARKLTRRTHAFTLWNRDRYAFGKAGDWFAVMQDDPRDYYIIQGYIFDETYEAADGTDLNGKELFPCKQASGCHVC